MSAQRPPTGTPVAARVAVLLAVLLVVPAVVLVHDLAADQGWTAERSWTDRLVDTLDGTSASAAYAVLGVALVVVGLLVLLAGLLPARRSHVPLADAPDAWVTPAAVAALARGVADRSAGVLEARTEKVTRRRVRISVRSLEDASGTARGAQRDVDEALAGLPRPAVSVRGVTRAA